MEISNLSGAEFKALVLRILKELSEDLSSMKKDPVRKEGYANWNKEQFTGNYSRVDEAENQINDLEHNEAKNNQSEQQEKKKESKKMRIV